MKPSFVNLPLLLLLLLSIFVGGCRQNDGAEASGKSDESMQFSQQPANAQYVGRQQCRNCHRREYDLYRVSDHDMSMDVANDSTVLGDFSNTTFTHFEVTSKFYKKNHKFYVYTEGPGGTFQEYEIKYTFGVRPLQQYLVEFPGGRLQCLPLCWDSRPKARGGQRWFHIYDAEHIAPNDILYWTRTAQNWNYMCAECHSTNLKKNFDYQSGQYHTRWSEIDVSCEACHGPGAAHIQWAEARERGEKADQSRDMGLTIRLKDRDGGTWVFDDPKKGTARRSVPRQSNVMMEMCARCHSRRSVISEEYVHGKPLLNTHQLSLLEGHLYYPDGQIMEEVYVYGSFLQSKMFQAGVVCSDCHEPHSMKVYAPGNVLCYRCHMAEKYDSPNHHFHEPGSPGASCVECHMPERTYMVIDPRRDHSIRIPRPDLSEKLNVPNACTQCHRDKPVKWAINAMEKWYRPFESRPRHYGETFWAGRRGYPEAQQQLLQLADERSTPVIVRATALSLLRNYPNLNSLAVLRTALDEADPLIRTAAIEALDIVNPNDRIELLTPLLTDPVRLVRINAARSLAEAPAGSFSSNSLRLRDEVLTEYIEIQHQNADNPSAYLNLGLLYLRRGAYTRAEAAYKKAIETEPYAPFGYINLTDLYRELNKEDEGQRILMEGLQQNPDAAAIHHSLGLLLVRKGQTDAALEYLAKAVAIEPENARYSYVYAIGLNSTGQSDLAVLELQKALQFNPYDRDLLFSAATIHRDRGELQKALSYAARLVESYPGDRNYQQLEQHLRYLSNQSESQ